MSYRLGYEAQILRGTSGSTASTAMSNVMNVTLNMSRAEAEVSTRSSGWKLTAATLADVSIEWEMPWLASDTNVAALRTAFIGNTAISLLVLDGSASGAQGLDCDVVITGFTRDEQLSDIQRVKITAKPTLTARAPAWYTKP